MNFNQEILHTIAKQNCIIQVVTSTEQSPADGENHPTTFYGTQNFVTMVINIRQNQRSV